MGVVLQILPFLLVTAAGGLAAFGLFMGTDELAARLRGRSEPSFDWFEGGPWSGRVTPAKTTVKWTATVLAGVAWLAIAVVALGMVFVAIGLGIQRLVS